MGHYLKYALIGAALINVVAWAQHAYMVGIAPTPRMFVVPNLIALSFSLVFAHSRHLAQAIRERQASLELLQSIRDRFIEHVISAEDAERRRLTRELHDETGQSLTSLSVGLLQVEQDLGEGDLKELVRGLRRQTTRSIDDVGRLARGLHPRILDDFGLAAAIRRHIAELEERCGMKIDLHMRGVEEGSRLSMTIETTIFRILQELLTNVVKHAAATAVSVILERDPQDVKLIVEDDGTGMTDDEPDSHHKMGLHGIRERVGLFKGTMTIESAAGVGTAVYIRVPIPEPGSDGGS